VLSNLVANALRYTPAGGSVRLLAEARPNVETPTDPLPAGVRICVSDTGSGIPAEDLPFIFDRFWRGDRARVQRALTEPEWFRARVQRALTEPEWFRARQNGSQGSTGLGLAITRQLVHAHGGKISVESKPGEGTVFTIDLPGVRRT